LLNKLFPTITNFPADLHSRLSVLIFNFPRLPSVFPVRLDCLALLVSLIISTTRFIEGEKFLDLFSSGKGVKYNTTHELYQMFIHVQMLATGKAYNKENGARFLSMEGINASTCLVI